MIAYNPPCGQVCRQCLEVFFRKYPNDLLRGTAYTALEKLLTCKIPLAGKIGG
jgi:hypothetical protein